MHKALFRPVHLLAVALLGCAPTGRVSHLGWQHQVVTSPWVDAQEVYFEIHPKRGAAFLRGYAPSVKSADEAVRHFEKMKGLIREKGFCREIFNFESIETVGERIFLFPNEGKAVPVFECQLRFTSPALDQSLEDFFSHLCRRDLLVGVGPDELGVNYFGSPIALSSHNASSHMFLKNKDGEVERSVIFWKTDQDRYFGVVGLADKAYAHILDATLFQEPVASPGFRD